MDSPTSSKKIKVIVVDKIPASVVKKLGYEIHGIVKAYIEIEDYEELLSLLDHEGIPNIVTFERGEYWLQEWP